LLLGVCLPVGMEKGRPLGRLKFGEGVTKTGRKREKSAGGGVDERIKAQTKKTRA